jgi:hypothetical protein
MPAQQGSSVAPQLSCDRATASSKGGPVGRTNRDICRSLRGFHRRNTGRNMLVT